MPAEFAEVIIVLWLEEMTLSLCFQVIPEVVAVVEQLKTALLPARIVLVSLSNFIDTSGNCTSAVKKYMVKKIFSHYN